MKRHTITAFLTLVIVIAAIGQWFVSTRRPPEEIEIVERIRNAPTLYLSVRYAEQRSGPEKLNLDREALAKSFRLKKKVGKYKVGSAIGLALHETTDETHAFLHVVPWTTVFIGENLYRIEPGFWTELMKQAPETTQWMQERTPDNVEEQPY